MAAGHHPFPLGSVEQPKSSTPSPFSVFLTKLDGIPSSTIPSGFIRNTKLMGSLYAKKQQQVDAIVSEFSSTVKHPISWYSLFESRMVISGGTITTTQAEHYSNIMDFYLQFKVINNENRVTAKSFATYLETHHADPDNSLLGLWPSKTIVQALRIVSDDEKSKEGTAEQTDAKSGGDPKSPSITLSPSLSASLLRSDLNLRSFASNFTVEELIEMILLWDEMNEDDAAICLHQFAASARNHTATGPPSKHSRLSLPPTTSAALSPSPSGTLKNYTSPSLLRSVSSNAISLSHVSTLSPTQSRPLSASGKNRLSGLFQKVDIPTEKPPPWKEGDVVIIFVGPVTDSQNREVLLNTIRGCIEAGDERAFMYARVNEPVTDEQNVSVYVDRSEQRQKSVCRECVFIHPFKHATSDLVCDVTQSVFAHLSTKLQAKTNKTLLEQGFDLQVLERTLSGEVQFFDIPLLRKNLAIMLAMQLPHNPTWAEFLTQARQYSETKVKKHLFDLEADGKVFPADRRQILEKFYHYDYAAATTGKLQSYFAATKAALDKLKKHQESILEGTAKHTLSEWYLEHIKDIVDSFLVRTGFELDVIPDNYIDQAPKDLALVQKNWAMMRELLDIITSFNSKNPTRHEVIDVMTSLMEDIYTRLDEFVRDSIFVLSEQLGVTRQYFDLAQNQDIFEECRSLFNTKQATYAKDLREKLEELIKDVEYVFKIREMEGLEQTQKSLDHVPISGLIASRFYRFENELRTALDVWDPERQAESESDESSSVITDDNNSPKFDKVVEGAAEKTVAAQ